MSTVSPLTHELSMYIATALHRPVPAAVCERAKQHVVDAFAAMIPGSRLPPGAVAVRYVKALGVRGDCGLVGTRMDTSPLHAALANGMFAHAGDGTDTPPGAGVIAATLAIGEARRSNGLQVLRAIVLGYDVRARVLQAVESAPFLRSGPHEGIGQVFGAAAAAGALLDFDALQVRHMLSYAAQQPGGLAARLHDGERVGSAYTLGGMPAHNGLQAALLVENGFTGPDDVFADERNFCAVFSAAPRRDALVAGLGREYDIAGPRGSTGAGETSTPADVNAAALERITPTLGRARAEELLAHLWNLEKLVDLHALRRLYQA